MVDAKGRVLQVVPTDPMAFDKFRDLSTSDDWSDCETTKRIGLQGNLDTNSHPVAAFDVDNPTTTSNSQTSVTAIGADKQSRQMEIYFRHRVDNDWE